MKDHEDAHEEANELEGPTPGAQRQLDAMRARMHSAFKKAFIAFALIVFGFAATAYQINKAFDTLEAERVSRLGAQSSINAYFCRKIDQVGNGVASLVAVSLTEAPPLSSLTPEQRRAFNEYIEQQKRPPQCRLIALRLAVLTGADPNDVHFQKLRLYPDE